MLKKYLLLGAVLIVSAVIGSQGYISSSLAEPSSNQIAATSSSRPAASPQKAAPVDPVKAQIALCTPTTGSVSTNVFGLAVLDFYDARAIAAVKDLGVKWVRIDFNRQYIEPQPGVYNWSDYDTFMVEMQKANINVLAIISHTPPWISWSNWDAQYKDVSDFSAKVVARYKPGGLVAQAAHWPSTYGIRNWEIFNEPNLPGYGWLDAGTPLTTVQAAIGNYVVVLAFANQAIHKQDPKAVIVSGGLSPDGVSPSTFVQTLYSYAPNKCFDVFAFHPYGSGGQFTQLAANTRTILAQYGDGAKPIWFNEFGTNDESQAVTTLNTAWSTKSSVQGVFWFSLKDLDTASNKFGLVNMSYVQKPIYAVFKSLMHQ